MMQQDEPLVATAAARVLARCGALLRQHWGKEAASKAAALQPALLRLCRDGPVSSAKAAIRYGNAVLYLCFCIIDLDK